MTAIVFFGSIKSNVKRFCSILAYAMIFLFFINVIVIGLLWYVIPLLRNWPSEIKLELHLKANIILCNLIVFPLDNGIEMVPVFFVCITYSVIITKSIFLAFVFDNNFQFLHKWQNAYKSRNQISMSTFFRWCFFAMQAFLTGSSINNSILSESSAFFAAWYARS